MTVVLSLLRRFWYVIPILGLTIALAISNHHLSDARKALAGEDEFRSVLQTRLGAKTSDHAMLFAMLDAALATSANRKVTLDQISREALTDKQRADTADAQLKREQVENGQRFAAAQREIAALESRKSSGNRDTDWQILEQDTQAPWKDWK